MQLTGRLLAATALIANAFVWGVSWWPFRFMEKAGLHPLWATGLMFVIVMLVVALYQPNVCRELLTTPTLWLLALASGFTNVGFNWAVTVGDVVRVVLLFYLMPAWALLLARWLLKEPISPQAMLRLALAVVGVLLVLKKPDTSWPVPISLADWLALGGGFTFALTNILIRKLDKASETGRLFAMFAGGAITAVFVGTWGVLAKTVPPLPNFSWLLLLAVVAMAVAFLLANFALQYGASRLKSSVTSLIMLSEIIFASLSAVWLGAAVLEANVLWGAALIFSAATWSATAQT